MNKFPRWAALAAAVLSLYCLISWAEAQAPARPAAGPNIALLDVSYLFKNHARFKGMMEDMKADVQTAENQVKAERDAITKLAERLGEFRKGTQEYQQSEEQLARRQADLAVRVNLQKGEFMQREAKIYYTVYQEIGQATDYYCKQNGVDMVLRFNGEKVDTDQPQSVLTYINKPVVWYQERLDITPNILQELNRTAINPGTARPGGAPVRPTVPFQR